jgi:recombinational DNA repair protein (RecF pathway)
MAERVSLAELQARFRLQFVETARTRLTRARASAQESDLATVALELHILAGEAALLAFTECVRCAHAAEALARSGEGRRCREALEPMSAAIEAVATV